MRNLHEMNENLVDNEYVFDLREEIEYLLEAAIGSTSYADGIVTGHND